MWRVHCGGLGRNLVMNMGEISSILSNSLLLNVIGPNNKYTRSLISGLEREQSFQSTQHLAVARKSRA